MQAIEYTPARVASHELEFLFPNFDCVRQEFIGAFDRQRKFDMHCTPVEGDDFMYVGSTLIKIDDDPCNTAAVVKALLSGDIPELAPCNLHTFDVDGAFKLADSLFGIASEMDHARSEMELIGWSQKFEKLMRNFLLEASKKPFV